MSLILNILVVVVVVYVAKQTRIRITDNEPGELELFKNFGDKPTWHIATRPCPEPEPHSI